MPWPRNCCGLILILRKESLYCLVPWQSRKSLLFHSSQEMNCVIIISVQKKKKKKKKKIIIFHDKVEKKSLFPGSFQCKRSLFPKTLQLIKLTNIAGWIFVCFLLRGRVEKGGEGRSGYVLVTFHPRLRSLVSSSPCSSIEVDRSASFSKLNNA